MTIQNIILILYNLSSVFEINFKERGVILENLKKEDIDCRKNGPTFFEFMNSKVRITIFRRFKITNKTYLSSNQNKNMEIKRYEL